MWQCVIIDDQQDCIDILMSHIADKSELKLVGYFTDALEGLNFLKQNKVDILFLDIDMPKLSGFDVMAHLKTISDYKTPYVVFSTGYQEYAVKGYDLGIADYLLKPVSFSRFNLAIERILQSMQKDSVQNDSKEDYFFSDYEGKKVKVNYDEIIYIESSGNYTILHTNDKRLVLLKSLSELESLLNAKKFIRIHKSYIINTNNIASFANNEVQLKYKQGILDLPIGRTYKEDFQKSIHFL
jgi:DNA-binding LytR/AlgR family response regulator